MFRVFLFILFTLFFCIDDAVSLQFNAKDSSKPINTYTTNEKVFIKSHIIKCISTATWAPFNSLKNGKLDGLAVDYWKIIKNKLNLKSNCKIAKNWSNVLRDIRNKKADLTISTDITPKKKHYAIFSKPYATFPIVLATKNDIGFIPNIRMLRGKKIATGKNYTAYDFLKTNYPNIDIVQTKDIDDALTLLCKGKVFAVIDALPVIAYKISKYKFSNLKISGRTPWNFNARIMARSDYKELISAINKAIDSIDSDEKIKINNRWLTVRHNKGYSVNMVLSIIIVSILIILIILGWVFHLKKEIAKRKKLEKELERLATTDNLTTIFNRYKMDIVLEKQVALSKRYKRPFSLIYFDIDHFKRVNDTFGHKTGDMILVELSKLVQKSIRKSDIFGRWGGEEFLIILPETHKNEAIELAHKLRETVQNHNFTKIKKLTCSFGIASYKDGDDTQSIIMRIDKRLYRAKKEGRNRVESI